MLSTVRFLAWVSGPSGLSTPNALLLAVRLFKSELAYVRLVSSAKERAWNRLAVIWNRVFLTTNGTIGRVSQ